MYEFFVTCGTPGAFSCEMRTSMSASRTAAHYARRSTMLFSAHRRLRRHIRRSGRVRRRAEPMSGPGTSRHLVRSSGTSEVRVDRKWTSNSSRRRPGASPWVGRCRDCVRAMTARARVTCPARLSGESEGPTNCSVATGPMTSTDCRRHPADIGTRCSLSFYDRCPRLSSLV